MAKINPFRHKAPVAPPPAVDDDAPRDPVVEAPPDPPVIEPPPPEDETVRASVFESERLQKEGYTVVEVIRVDGVKQHILRKPQAR